MSRGNPLYGEWRLHPQVVEQILADIQPGRRRSLHSLSAVLLPVRHEHITRRGCSGPSLTRCSVVFLLIPLPDFSDFRQSALAGAVANFGDPPPPPPVAIQTLGGRDNTNSSRGTMATPCVQGSCFPGSGQVLSLSSRPVVPVGLAETIQYARAPSTH